MSEITPAHIEWAAVSRLATMLEIPHPEFNVTQAYGLLAPIVCWVVQRVRAEGDGRVEPLRNNLKAALIANAPWAVSSTNIINFSSGTLESVKDLTAYDFFVGLRNAISHGDARKVRPLNSQPDNKDRCMLEGFSFDCSSDSTNRPRRLIWRGTVHLYERDMRRIGLELAEQFCDSLGSKKPNFEAIASQRVLERA